VAFDETYPKADVLLRMPVLFGAEGNRQSARGPLDGADSRRTE